jgi:hypothetical protein
MGEKLSECLSRLATVLHWHGKHNETNAVVLLGRLARASGLGEDATIDDLAKFVEDVELGKRR